MFQKREKKIYPPGTFIPFPARVAAIFHLCLGFTLLLGVLSKPFMGDLFEIKSEVLLYESVLNSPHVHELDEGQIQKLKTRYQGLKQQLQLPFLEKIFSALELLLFPESTLEQMWLIFSIILPICLLIRIEGAAQACWALPILTLAFAFENSMLPPQKNIDNKLFPTEQHIVFTYLEKPLSSSIFEQREQLLRGWQLYLIKEWRKETPSKDKNVFVQQVDKGELAFNTARLMSKPEKFLLAVDKKPAKKPLLLLGACIIWNLVFAYIAMKKSRLAVSEATPANFA